ncbi:MAG: TraI domain-containing protein [Legionellales bacterium]|jgi:hypothetical protein
MQYSRNSPPQNTAPPKRDQRVKAIQTAAQLLEASERSALIQEIKELSAASSKDYQAYYESLINNFAEFVQELESIDHPAITWLDHQLRLAKTSLKLREQFLLVGESLRPIVNEQEALWYYAIFSSALLRRIGLIFSHYQVSICTEQGVHTKDWLPFDGSMNAQGNYYKLREITDKGIPAAQSINQLLARQLMPAAGFSWIATNPAALNAWLGIVDGESSGGVSHTLVALSEKLLYALAEQEALLEELFRQDKLEELLRITHLTEQELLKLLPPLHGERDPNNPLAVEFYDWLDSKNLEGTDLLIAEQQYLLSPIAISAMMADAPAQFKNWFNFYKNGLKLGLTTLTPSDKALQTYLVKSTQVAKASAPIAAPAAKSTADTLFHKTLHENAPPTAPAPNNTPDAIKHQQNVEHTVHSLNNQGLMVGALFGSAHYHAYTARNLAATQKQQSNFSQMTVNEIDTTKDKVGHELFTKHKQQQELRQKQLRRQVEAQYPQATVTVKSNFSYGKRT